MSETTRCLIQFLTDDLLISSEAITIALHQCDSLPNLIPIVLWQYGFINLSELERIFDWLAETTCVICSAHPSGVVTP